MLLSRQLYIFSLPFHLLYGSRVLTCPPRSDSILRLLLFVLLDLPTCPLFVTKLKVLTSWHSTWATLFVCLKMETLAATIREWVYYIALLPLS